MVAISAYMTSWVCWMIRDPCWEGVRVSLSSVNLERRASMRPSKSFVRVLRW